MTVIVTCLKQDHDMISNVPDKFQTCHNHGHVTVMSRCCPGQCDRNGKITVEMFFKLTILKTNYTFQQIFRVFVFYFSIYIYLISIRCIFRSLIQYQCNYTHLLFNDVGLLAVYPIVFNGNGSAPVAAFFLVHPLARVAVHGQQITRRFSVVIHEHGRF